MQPNLRNATSLSNGCRLSGLGAAAGEKKNFAGGEVCIVVQPSRFDYSLSDASCTLFDALRGLRSAQLPASWNIAGYWWIQEENLSQYHKSTTQIHRPSNRQLLADTVIEAISIRYGFGVSISLCRLDVVCLLVCRVTKKTKRSWTFSVFQY
jgi:hypothetical protein